MVVAKLGPRVRARNRTERCGKVQGDRDRKSEIPAGKVLTAVPESKTRRMDTRDRKEKGRKRESTVETGRDALLLAP